MFRFKEMFICLYGNEAEKKTADLKKLLSASFIKHAGDSDVFFERPLLSDAAKTRLMIWNVTESKVEINGDVRFDKEFLVKDEPGATPQQLIN